MEKEMVIKYLVGQPIGSYRRNRTCAQEEDKLIAIECQVQGWDEGKARARPRARALRSPHPSPGPGRSDSSDSLLLCYTLSEDARLQR